MNYSYFKQHCFEYLIYRKFNVIDNIQMYSNEIQCFGAWIIIENHYFIPLRSIFRLEYLDFTESG